MAIPLSQVAFASSRTVASNRSADVLPAYPTLRAERIVSTDIAKLKGVPKPPERKQLALI
jgi:hypothetical protein